MGNHHKASPSRNEETMTQTVGEYLVRRLRIGRWSRFSPIRATASTGSSPRSGRPATSRALFRRGMRRWPRSTRWATRSSAARPASAWRPPARVSGSDSDMADRLFQNRRDAGRVLAGLLKQYRDRDDVIVLGLPRGGVPVAYEVARALGAPLDVFLVRKLGLPRNPELAMGAIASGGTVVINDDVVRGLGISPVVIEQ